MTNYSFQVIVNLTITYAGVGYTNMPGGFAKLFAVTLNMRSCQARYGNV